jgi:hypothetical protein
LAGQTEVRRRKSSPALGEAHARAIDTTPLTLVAGRLHASSWLGWEAAMEVKGSHHYAVPVDSVIAMLQDKKSTVDKYQAMGHRDVKLLELAGDETTLRIVSSRVVDVDLPGFAKKALKPTNTMTQTDQWHRNDDGSWSGTFDVDVKGSPVHIAGTMALAADGTGTRHDVTINVQVKIPIIGGKIAEWAGKNDVRRTLDAEFDFNDQRLAST